MNGVKYMEKPALKKVYFTLLKVGMITTLALLAISLVYFIVFDYQSSARIFGEKVCRVAMKTAALTFIVSFGGDIADKLAGKLGKR